MKIFKSKIMRLWVIWCFIWGTVGFIFLSQFPDIGRTQSLQSPSYYNQLFLAFVKARVEHRVHDATVLKTLLMAQEHPNAKAKLAKLCKKFIKDEKIEDQNTK